MINGMTIGREKKKKVMYGEREGRGVRQDARRDSCAYEMACRAPALPRLSLSLSCLLIRLLFGVVRKTFICASIVAFSLIELIALFFYRAFSRHEKLH